MRQCKPFGTVTELEEQDEPCRQNASLRSHAQLERDRQETIRNKRYGSLADVGKDGKEDPAQHAQHGVIIGKRDQFESLEASSSKGTETCRN